MDAGDAIRWQTAAAAPYGGPTSDLVSRRTSGRIEWTHAAWYISQNRVAPCQTFAEPSAGGVKAREYSRIRAKDGGLFFTCDDTFPNAG